MSRATPTNDEIRKMAESLEAPIYWMAGVDAPSAEENVTPRLAAIMLRAILAEREERDIVYLRDLDGTGSMHPCLEGDPGAIPYSRKRYQ